MASPGLIALLPFPPLPVQLSNEFLEAMGTGPRDRSAWHALHDLIELPVEGPACTGKPLGSALGGRLFTTPGPHTGTDGQAASPRPADFTFALPSATRNTVSPH